MNQIDKKDSEYFVKLLTEQLTKTAEKVAAARKISLEGVITEIINKFSELNVALKNDSEGQLLVNNLNEYKKGIAKGTTNTAEEEAQSEPATAHTEEDIKNIIDSQENLIYIIYPKLVKEE